MTRKTRTAMTILSFAVGLAGCDGTRAPTAPSTVVRAPSPNQSGYALTASTTTVTPGGALSVSWSVPKGGARDWVGLFSVGAAPCDHGWSEYTNGATSGTFTLQAPAKPGQYEFRYLPDDSCSDTARSSPVTVSAATYTLTASPSAVAPGGELSVSWTASTSGPLDWIGLFGVGVPCPKGTENTGGWWQYTNGASSGTFTLRAPTVTGQYQFRYFPDDGCDAAALSGVVTVVTGG